MKVIDVRDQQRLSLPKCVELVLSGIKYRLFRAAITVAIVSLAVAFLMAMLTESLVTRRVSQEIDVLTAPRRGFTFWVSRIAAPLAEEALTRELASAGASGPRWKEFRTWGKLDDAKLGKLVAVAAEQRRYLAFFEGVLSEGERRPLVGRARGAEIFSHLQDQAAYASFEKAFVVLAQQMHTDLPTFKAFMGDWRASREDFEAIRTGHRSAIEALAGVLGEKEPKAFLAESTDRLIGALAELGFQISPAVATGLQSQAQLAVDAERLGNLLNTGLVKRRLADRKKVDLPDVNAHMFFSQVASGAGQRWFQRMLSELSGRVAEIREQLPTLRQEVPLLQERAETMEMRLRPLTQQVDTLTAAGASPQDIRRAMAALDEARQQLKTLREGPDGRSGLNLKRKQLDKVTSDAQILLPIEETIEFFRSDPGRARQVAAEQLRQSRLSEIQASLSDLSGPQDAFAGFSTRALWLISVSFLVCVVGIANAMLMSVTERFQEIATMKCLGATDGYIMINFILESCMQGAAGGVIGAVLGFGLGALRSWAIFGWMAMEQLQVASIFAVAGISLAIGMVLSAMAAMYPAWIAARLAPMEAMRIE